MKYARNMAAFVKSVSEGSFTAAALALGVSPAAISKSVHTLERELGIRLLNRSTRRLALTEEGGVFYGHCRSAMLELENAVNAVAEVRREPTGVLRVTSAVLFGRHHVLPLLGEFAARYPRVTLDIVLEDRFVDLIPEGYDVSIRSDVSPVSGQVARRITAVQAIVCGSPAYFRRHRLPRTPEELDEHNCIRFRSVGTRRVLEWEFQRNRSIYSRKVDGTLVLSDPEGICSAVVDGRGLGQLPGFLAAPLIKKGKLRPVLLDHLSQSRTIYASRSAGKYVAPRIRAFVDFVVEKLADNPNLRYELRA